MKHKFIMTMLYCALGLAAGCGKEGGKAPAPEPEREAERTVNQYLHDIEGAYAKEAACGSPAESVNCGRAIKALGMVQKDAMMYGSQGKLAGCYTLKWMQNPPPYRMKAATHACLEQQGYRNE
jgi:hypothetical protein